MKLSKVSLTTIVIVGLAIGLFIIARKKFPVPQVKAILQNDHIYTGVHSAQYLNGDERMIASLVKNLPEGTAEAIRDEAMAAQVYSWIDPFTDHDRVF